MSSFVTVTTFVEAFGENSALPDKDHSHSSSPLMLTAARVIVPSQASLSAVNLSVVIRACVGSLLTIITLVLLSQDFSLPVLVTVQMISFSPLNKPFTVVIEDSSAVNVTSLLLLDHLPVKPSGSVPVKSSRVLPQIVSVPVGTLGIDGLYLKLLTTASTSS